MTTTKTTREQYETLVPQIQTMADDLDAKGAEVSDEDIESINKALADAARLKGILDAQKAAGQHYDMAAAFAGGANVAAPAGDPEVRDGIVNPNGMTLGEAFTKSPAFADFLKVNTASDGRIKEKGAITMDAFTVPGFGAKSLVTGLSDTSAGAMIQGYRYAPVTDLIGVRELTVRDLCTNITIDSDSFEYVRITGKTNNAAAVLEATVSATPGLNNVAVGAYDATHGVKPESALALAALSTPVETIAHLMPITRRAVADAPQVRQLVDQFLIDGLREEEEDQILNGSGTSPNLKGILQDGAISTVGSAGTDLDAVVDAIRTIRNDRRKPNAMVIHPNDWFTTGFLLAKDTAGNYLIGDPRRPVDQLNALWGLQVVVTEAMTENTVLVGDFKQYVVADREQSAIYVTDSHNDHFARNILDILAEERLAGAVLDPDAFCTVTSV